MAGVQGEELVSLSASGNCLPPTFFRPFQKNIPQLTASESLVRVNEYVERRSGHVYLLTESVSLTA